MYQLVAEHVIIVRVDAGERHYHARPQTLSDTARSLRERLANHVRLLKVRLIGIEHHGLAIEGMTKAVRVARVPPLGEASGVVHNQRLGRVEVEIEV